MNRLSSVSVVTAHDIRLTQTEKRRRAPALSRREQRGLLLSVIILSMPSQRRFQMRKLILIAVIATMSSSACYANLSLASNEPPQGSIEQPTGQALDAKAEVKAEAPVTIVKSPAVARPKPRHYSGRAFVIRRSYGHCL
jgi:hypothetical protein